MAKVGTPLIDIELEDGAEGHSVPTDTSSSSSSSAAPSSSSSSSSGSVDKPAGDHSLDKVMTTPAVRFIAKASNVDLTKVTGTGKDGRILKEDVLNYIAKLAGSTPAAAPLSAKQPAAAPAASAAAFTQTPAPAAAAAASSTTAAAAAPVGLAAVARVLAEDVKIPLTGIRKGMFRSMTQSASIPHLGFCDEYRVNELVKVREALRAEGQKQGLRLTYLPILIKAFSRALTEVPGVNATYDADSNSVVIKAAHNIGIAMSTPEGLIVPNIKNVERKSIFEIAGDLARLQTLGQQGKLGLADLTGGTITISSIGHIGGTYFSPVILAPETTIVALGAIQTLPRFDDAGKVIEAKILNASFSCDHRVIDGATVANFSRAWQRYVENPVLLLSNLS